MDNKFPYGTDVNKYIEKALLKIRVAHPWATPEMFNKKYSYAIEEKNGQFVYVSYYKRDDGGVERNEYDRGGDKFIELIIGNNESWVESSNPVKDVFELPVPGGVDICGWTLERYEFRTHKLGGYSSAIQAGNRYTGGNRDFLSRRHSLKALLMSSSKNTTKWFRELSDLTDHTLKRSRD